MDPITAAALAVALLAGQKGAEKLGEQAGQATWSGLSSLTSLIRSKFLNGSPAEVALTRIESGDADESSRVVATKAITDEAGRDRAFAERLVELVENARESGRVTTQVAIQAETVKSVFTERVTVHGDFTIN